VVDAMIRQPFTTETIPYNIKYTKPANPFLLSITILEEMVLHILIMTQPITTSIQMCYTNWNQGWSYRNDGVDIETCTDTDANNGYSVGWTGNNEWMEYTVEVDSTAGYTLIFVQLRDQVAQKYDWKLMELSITPVISLPGTSGWYNWRTTEFQELSFQKEPIKSGLFLIREVQI
jgi:endoglucanase